MANDGVEDMKQRRIITIALIISLTGIAAAASGCGEEPPPPPPPTVKFPVTVSVKSAAGSGVPKAPVLFGEKVVGYTDAEGEFKALLTRQTGSELTISVGPREGFRYLDETSVTEQLKSTEVNGALVGVPLLLEVDAQSTRNDYFFWIRAECDDNLPDDACEGLEVKIEDEVVATTNELGYAQFTLAEIPETAVEIRVDTPDFDPKDDDSIAMIPNDPVYKVGLDLEPQVYVIQEEFVNARPQKKRRRRRTRRRRSRPTKSTAAPKKETKIEEGDDGVIDLF